MHFPSRLPLARPFAVAAASLILVVGCQQVVPASPIPAPQQPGAAAVVDIMATDFAFQAPDTFPAGLVTSQSLTPALTPRRRTWIG